MAGKVMKAFAIIRHEKIKAGRHLVSAGLHNVRAVHTPNANKNAPAPQILIGTHKPWRDVTRNLARLGISKVRKDGNVALEIFLGASPEWWADKGWQPGVPPTGETLALVQKWKAAQLAYLFERFGEHLIANVVFHLDEASPHIHAFVIPAQFRKDGRERGSHAGNCNWRLSSEKMLKGPAHMKAIVTEYAKRMEEFGLHRGAERKTGKTQHKPLKIWQAEQADLSNLFGLELMKQVDVTAQARADAGRIRQDADDYARQVRTRIDRETEEARELAIQREEMLRRKEDATTAARLEAQIENARVADLTKKIEEERAAVQRIRDRLEKMINQVEKILEPIRSFATKYLESSPLTRQAIGTKGPEAVKISNSEEVFELESMRKFMSSRGVGR